MLILPNSDGVQSDGESQHATFPFGSPVSLSSISGPTYVTAQLLVQQVAYLLSDKVFSHSFPTFALDSALGEWATRGHHNIHEYPTTVASLQTRSGAGTFALGYVFSPDFDPVRRHVPQSLVAPSLALRVLRNSLDQWSLLYGVSSPFVSHVAAVGYGPEQGLVADYDTALRTAEDLGMGLVVSSSTYEVQHMAIFATLMSTILPTLHVYDGIRMPRETLRIADGLSEVGVKSIHNKLASEFASINKRLDATGKTLELLKLLNRGLGTAYQPFEYHGHQSAETVLVVLGSAESRISMQVAEKMAGNGDAVGVVNVRIYRPFDEDEFLRTLPPSAHKIAVLGQVGREGLVVDTAAQSALYADVLTATSLSDLRVEPATVTEHKYVDAGTITSAFISNIFHKLAGHSPIGSKSVSGLLRCKQYAIWSLDGSATANSATTLGKWLSKQSANHVYLHEGFDNLSQGGIVRSDIRISRRAIDAPYAIEESDITAVGDEKVLKAIDIVDVAKPRSTLLISLPNYNDEEAEKRIPQATRDAIYRKKLELYVLDTSYSPSFEKDPTAAKLLFDVAFLTIARSDLHPQDIENLVALEGSTSVLHECVDALSLCLQKVEGPQSWTGDKSADFQAYTLPSVLSANSFAPRSREEEEVEEADGDWKTAAKGLVFKEAYGTRTSLRPDLSVTTTTVTVKENRRLTPTDYDRNIFHIEFDLGDSGLSYKIGEALGIHAENDESLVEEFERFYGLHPDDLVTVTSREDASVQEVRTVRQALMQNADILGKPPKRFYESLAKFATDEAEKKKLTDLGGSSGVAEFKRRSEVDTITYNDILREFPSARPSFHHLIRIVAPLKRREYSIASAQAVSPTTVALMIVVVDWVDTKGRARTGQASSYLSRLRPGAQVTVSVKPSVMKLPTKSTTPLIMAGLGTGLAPFRAFVQHRALQKANGEEIGPILLYMGSRHQREEYLYGEEWEAYLAAGVVTLLGAAFSRDQPQKIYIQDRMRETMREIVEAFVRDEGAFYLCGPTWPVPDVTEVLKEAIAEDATKRGARVDTGKEVERVKEIGRYVLEVY